MFSFHQNKDQEDTQNNDSLNSQVQQNEELTMCKSELQQAKESFVRLTADFDNYKKRVDRDRSNWITNSQSEILLDILAIVDDFDRAFASYKKGENEEVDKSIVGFELIQKSLYKLLDKYSVKEIIDISLFNPEIHESIAQVESESHKSGDIVTVVQKGYTLKGNLLRPARVTIAK